MRVLLLEGIHPRAKEMLEREGFQVRLESHSPSEKDLIGLLKDADAVGIRSKTQLNRTVLEASSHLQVIGAFCIGTDQVASGVANGLSVAELVICEIISLSRQLGDRNMKAHQGEWLKSAEGSHEVRGKTLGLVGYGHIGSQVSVLAESLGMRVVYYDVIKKLPLGNSLACRTLAELLEKSDFVSLHVPDTASTRGMIGREQLAQMRRGSSLIKREIWIRLRVNGGDHGLT